MKYFSVVPEEIVEKYGDDFRRNPVGTGPFLFKMWEEGNKLILNKNPNYFEKQNNQSLPYIDGIAVSFIKDKETAFLQFMKGEFDMVSGVEYININEVFSADGTLKEFYNKKFELQKSPYLKTDYLGFFIDETKDNVKKSPIRLKAIRRAINYAFDRRKLIKYHRNNLGIPAVAGFIPQGMPSFNENVVKGYEFNADKVRENLIEAGYPEGKGLPEITLHVTESAATLAEFIQSELAANNIKIKVVIDNTSVLKQAVNAGEFIFFKKSWIMDYGDEENILSLFYSKNFSPSGVNYMHYKNEEFDILFEKAMLETVRQKKNEMYQQMDQLLMDDAPVVPLFYDQVIRLVQPNVKDFYTNPMNLLNLKYTKLEDKE